jgi:hypothetical protein
MDELSHRTGEVSRMKKKISTIDLANALMDSAVPRSAGCRGCAPSKKLRLNT